MLILVRDSVVARVGINPGGQAYTVRKLAKPAGKLSTLLISLVSSIARTLAMYVHVLAPEADANDPACCFC